MGSLDRFGRRTSDRDLPANGCVSRPDSIGEESDREEVEELKGNKQPSQIANIHNLRRVSGYAAPGAKPTVRVTMVAKPKSNDGFVFDPIEFDLVENGPSICLARIPTKYRSNAPTMKEPLKVLFKSRTMTRGNHAHIWCKNGKVFVQDAGSSAGTLLNEHILAHMASTVSIPYQIESGDVLQLGNDYTKTDPDKIKDPSVVKCVRALILIKSIPAEERNQKPAPMAQEQTEPESEAKMGPMSIAFDCQPYCLCPWRTLFHEKGIYSIDLSVSGPRAICLAVESWLLRHPNVDEKWGGWKEAEAAMMISVIEKIIGAMKSSPADVLQCQSWIRKIARHTGALPDSFVLKDVTRTSQHPVSCGGFADIYIGQYEGKEVALKVLRIFNTQESKRTVFRDVIHEALFWKHLNHPHILPFLGISQSALVPHLCLVSPWMTNGDIMNYIAKHSKADRLSLIAQCSHGLRYLHEYNPGLVHGDIRGANILIDGDGNVRITDFGLITITETQARGTSFTVDTEGGPARWMAPELLKAPMRKNRSTDVYAFGMAVLEIYTNAPPFADYANKIKIIVAIISGARPSRPALEQIQMYEDLWALINRCWDLNPNDRPSMREVATNLDSLLTLRVRGLLSFASNTSQPSLNPFRNPQSFPLSNI